MQKYWDSDTILMKNDAYEVRAQINTHIGWSMLELRPFLT